MNFTKNAARLLCLLGWACLLLLTIQSSLLIPEHFVVAGVDLGPDLSYRQHMLYVWVGSGLVVALIGLRFDHLWIATTAVSALIHLIGWILRGPIPRVGPVDGYRLMWRAATELDAVVPFLLRDIFVPLIFVLALTGALVTFFWKKSSGPMAVQ